MNRDNFEDSQPDSGFRQPCDAGAYPGVNEGEAKAAPVPHLHSLARAMAKGVGVLVAAGVISRLFSVVSSPILTRLVGPSPYGVLALIGTVSSLAASVALMGVDLAYARFFFVGARGDAYAVERFCWRFALALGMLFSFLAGTAWWFWVRPVTEHRDLAPMAGLTTLVAVLSVMAMTRQRILGAYVRIAAATLVGSGSGVLLSIILAKLWRSDAWAMLSGTLAGSILSLGMLGLPRSRVLMKKSNLDTEQRREILGLGIASTATAPMFWVISSVDRWLLGLWTGAEPLGVYAFAASIGLSGMLVTSAVTMAWFPEVSREFGQSGGSVPMNIARLWARLAGLYMVTWLATAAVGGDVIRWLADPRFHGGATLIPWIAGGVFFYGIAGLANTGLLLKNDLKPTALWWTLGAAFNVVANVLWIRFSGPFGAAIVGCLTFALIAGGMLRAAQLRLALPLPWVRLGNASAITLVVGVLLASPWSDTPWKSLLLKFPIGILVSATLGFILAPDWVQRLFIRVGRSSPT